MSLDTPNVRLHAARKRLGKTQAQMAGALHLSTKGYQRYEAGERDIPISVLDRALIHLRLRPEWVLDGIGEMLAPKIAPADESSPSVTAPSADLAQRIDRLEAAVRDLVAANTALVAALTALALK